MPLVRIEVLKGRPPSEKQRLLGEVHSALVEALEIPEDDRTQRLIEHDPENFEIPPGHSERYTLVEITAFQGRSEQAKGRLYRTIVRNLGGVGIPAEDIFIVLIEPPMENWGIRGGQAASQVELGFNVEI